MSFPIALYGSATTGCWPTAIGRRLWPCAVRFSPVLRHDRNRRRPIGKIGSRVSPVSIPCGVIVVRRPCVWSVKWRRPSSEGSAAMILRFIARCQYLSAQPWRQGVVYPTRVLRYNRRREIAVVEPGPAADPFAGRSSDSLTAAVGGGVEVGRESREAPAKDLNPHRTAPDSPAASFKRMAI